MQLPVIKAVLATAWILSAVGIMAGANHLSLIDHLTLGFLAVVPPVTMWFSWNEPTRTMSESIHGVRNERAAVPAQAPRGA
jgi:hypothetical protein